jgi:DNA polymerase I-like protein with 3'-5' exonuclease and polymerase domains
MTFGTTAGRAAQYGWVNAPSVQALYGENIRKIIIAPEGSKLIGIDMPSAHPRLLADFTQNEMFIAAVDGKEEDEDGNYVGEDFHTVNSVLFRLNTNEDVVYCRESQAHDDRRSGVDAGRKKGKGGSYCTLYGGSDKKLALTLGIAEKLGAELKKSFLSGLGLDLLLEEVSSTWKKQKRDKGSYISVLGGYHAWSNSKHKIINFKALGSEAVVQKRAVILLCRKFRDMNLKSKLILNIHDEVLLEVPDEEVEIVKPIAARMYVEAALELGLTLDWISTAKVGIDYAKCH